MTTPASIFGTILTYVGIVLYFRHPNRKWAALFLVGSVISQLGLWVGLWNSTVREYPLSSAVVDFITLVFAAAGSMVFGLARIFQAAVVFFVLTLSLLLVNSTATYWSLGGKAGVGFSERLTQLDALYFAVGTLTTAGTGSIDALSTKVRTYVTVQMGLDFLLVVVALAVIIGGILSATSWLEDLPLGWTLNRGIEPEATTPVSTETTDTSSDTD